MRNSQDLLAILGCGTMGHSIALSAALSGFEVTVWGTGEEDIARARQGIADKMKVLLSNEIFLDEEYDSIAERIRYSLSIEECVSGRTFIIEAIPENLAMKQEMFQYLDSICDPNVILASNTSGLSPTAIAQNTVHKHRTVVTHFWNPGHLIPLVEVVRGEYTSDETVERALTLLHAIDKKPIVVKKDILGSIVNRLQYALFREAQYILEQGVATAQDIDSAVQYSIGRRLSVTGPFMSADMGGLDVFDAISSYLFPDLSTHQASLSMMQGLVSEGKFGQKNGSGFYEWTPEFNEKMNRERESELVRWLKKDRQEKGV